MAKCGACGKFLSMTDGVACSHCSSTYHRGCLKIPDGATVAPGWLCPNCKVKIPRSDNSGTPVKGLAESYIYPDQSVSIHGDKDESQCQNMSLDDTTHNITDDLATHDFIAEFKLFRAEIQALRTELRYFREDMADIKKSITSCNSRIDQLDARMDSIEKNLQVGDSADLLGLQTTIQHLQEELDDRDRTLLLNDIELSGVPEFHGESGVHIIIAIAKKLGVELDERDVVSVSRAGPRRVGDVGEPNGADGTTVLARHRARPLVVRLSRRVLRDDLLRAARVRRRSTTADLGLPQHEPRPFYINERLTKQNRSLFGRAREAGKAACWKYIWTRDGRVYARREDHSPVQLLRSATDIGRVFGSVSHDQQSI